MKKKEVILQSINISKFFTHEKKKLLVLKNINFCLYKNEIVSLLGQSGSGKSTFLRILSGLIKPCEGFILYQGKRNIKSLSGGLSMVFQHASLMPWLTVLQNVELGLEALGVDKKERRKRSLEAIDIIGLDGFESAYPRELSGGMCQRIGFARAIVVNPTILLMDEPFSSLDILTTENLRNDLLNLWINKTTNIKSIILVTHNIEESVYLSDRIILFNNNPGSIKKIMKVNLNHPRIERDIEFQHLVKDIYISMTKSHQQKNINYRINTISYVLPNIEISEFIGFLEAFIINNPNNNIIHLSELEKNLFLDLDNILPIIKALEILHFASIIDGTIQLNEQGLEFEKASILNRKKIFAKHLLLYIPLVQHIIKILKSRPHNVASEKRFLIELEDDLDEKIAKNVLKIAIEWGRYSELFSFDSNKSILIL